MRAMRVLILRHHEEDWPGLVGEAFAARGAKVDTYLYSAKGPLPDLEGYDCLVVLGSSASVYETRDWIAAELDWLRSTRLPVFGICFGAQLLSACFGGAVERSAVYELGWVTVEPVEPADGDANAPVIGRGPWFEFHGDRCVLPSTARLLARNAVGVQAFTIGPHLGVQFHPEVDAAQLRRWIDHGGREAVLNAGKDPDALLTETARLEPVARTRAQELVDAYLAFAKQTQTQP